MAHRDYERVGLYMYDTEAAGSRCWSSRKSLSSGPMAFILNMLGASRVPWNLRKHEDKPLHGNPELPFVQYLELF